MKQAVIYEVRLDIDPEIEQEFDAWLADHVAEMLRFEGFMSAEVLVPDEASAVPDASSAPHPNPPPDGGRRIVRRVQYNVSSRAALERYFDEHADRMRQQGVQHFGDRFSATRSVYDVGIQPVRTCQNCNATLRGQYCEECGQRDKHRIISLWELFRDLVGDLFEIDSRVWRSLYPLLFKPGRLTTEYLRGRRVHYTPPLRLYLITSLLFFLVVFFNASPDVDFDIPTEADEIAEAMEAMDADPEDIAEVMTALEEVNVVAADNTAEPGPTATSDPESAVLEDTNVATADNSEVSGSIPTADPETGTGPEEQRGPCDDITISGLPWADTIEKKAAEACRNLTAKGGLGRFLRDLIDNAPATMFFFLPVIALVMAFLYPLSRRYYVEHLLFFVHFHSFFFLILTLTVLLTRLPEVLPGQGFATGLTQFGVWAYIHIYLFVAMRRVYGQSRVVTAVKFAVLGVAYFVSLLLSITAMAFITALSV